MEATVIVSDLHAKQFSFFGLEGRLGLSSNKFSFVHFNFIMEV